MKVITEETILELIDKNSGQDDILFQNVLKWLVNECKEIDTLTVTRLRPMSEAPIRGDILVKMKQGSRLMKGFCDDGLFYVPGNHFKLDECEGFIPMPRYEPEATK